MCILVQYNYVPCLDGAEGREHRVRPCETPRGLIASACIQCHAATVALGIDHLARFGSLYAA